MENRGTSLAPHAYHLATHQGFILASVGSAVDMANVWGSPYKTGNNGGDTFLLIYILFVLLFTCVGLPAEFANGHRARTGTLGTHRAVWATRGDTAGKIGAVLGWPPLASSLCIVIGYAVIVAYVAKALLDSVTGELMGVNIERWFEGFALQGFSVAPFHVIVAIDTLVTLFLGAGSIKKINRIMMPVFFMIFAILAVQVVFLPGATQGYLLILTPRQEALINPTVWVWTVGQASFSPSITGSGMIVYGTYLFDGESVVKVPQCMGFLDTLAVVVTVLVTTPTCSTLQTDVGTDPGLLSVTPPAIL